MKKIVFLWVLFAICVFVAAKAQAVSMVVEGNISAISENWNSFESY